MPQEYTRQRQGRDHTLHMSLSKALEETRRDDEAAQNGEVTRKTLLERLEQYSKETERNDIPVDGKEPSGQGGKVI